MHIIDHDGAKCKELRPILKEIDDGYDIHFNYETEKYVITHNGGLFQSVPYGEVDRKLLNEIRHTTWLNKRGNMLDYIEQENAALEASREREETARNHDLASDMYHTVMENYFYGDIHSDRYYKGGIQ